MAMAMSVAVAMAMVIQRLALASLGRPLADFDWPWLSAASVVAAAVGDQVSQVVSVQQVIRIRVKPGVLSNHWFAA